jgi:hypothetical protein
MMTVYRYGEDGPQLVNVCPGCGRYIKLPGVLLCNMAGKVVGDVACSKCGPVEIMRLVVGWGED